MHCTPLLLSVAIGVTAIVPLPIAAQTASATMPACAAGDPVVWFNTRSHAYHRSGDSYYGTTKHGRYACESEARAKGAHLAAARAQGANRAAQTPLPGAGDTTPKHHHRRNRGDGTPAPTAT